MSDIEDSDFQRVQRELRQVTNDLRRLRGEDPLPDAEGEPPFCSFCGKGKKGYRGIVKGPAAFICDECVREAQLIVYKSLAEDD